MRSEGRNPDKFLFVFWEKRWLHKFILKLSDFYATYEISLDENAQFIHPTDKVMWTL